MCRLLGYLGKSIALEELLNKPDNSLIVQSYQPKHMKPGALNLDGFGFGWYDRDRQNDPYIYKNILPILNDVNVNHLSKYVRSDCLLSYVRSATPPLTVDFINCQPFNSDKLLFIHNGEIKNFYKTLYRPVRDLLDDKSFEFIKGSTDSEHILALILKYYESSGGVSLKDALDKALTQLNKLATRENVDFSANIIISDGKQLVASRYAKGLETLSLYWLEKDPTYTDAVIIASEPLSAGNWQPCPENSLITVTEDLEVDVYSLPG